LILKVRTFLATFEGLKAPVIENNKVPDLDLSPLGDARTAIQKPGAWTGHPGSLFVSRRYIFRDPDLVDPFENSPGKPPVQLHPPVPNEWFIKYNLDITDPDILSEDTDGDGFSNLDEFLAGTDPLDKNSHPAYTTKLKLARFIKVPFRLIYNARPDADSYQINTVDINQPSQILKIGDPIVGTKFKLIKFEDKKMTDSNDIEHDISELTIQNTDTGAQVVLVYNKQVDSPDSYAVFKYLWNNTQITVKKDQEFVLKPETDVKYKLIDISDQEAVIQTKTGQKITIPHFEEEKH